MQTENQSKSKSHNRPHHKGYNRETFDKGMKKKLCRCPMCEPGKDLHYVRMDWQGPDNVVPVKFCRTHFESPDRYGDIEVCRMWG